MAKEWQTFVRRFEDMKEGEVKIFIKDLTPGPRKYDTKFVKASVRKSKLPLPDSDRLWVRSESGDTDPETWSIKVLEDLPPWVSGRPWEDLFKAIEKSQAEK